MGVGPETRFYMKLRVCTLHRDRASPPWFAAVFRLGVGWRLASQIQLHSERTNWVAMQ